MQAIAFPFRFNRGRVVTADTTTDAYIAQKVASAASTRTGELPLLPLFGTEDPEFDDFDLGGLFYTCAIFFPEVQIVDVVETLNDNGTNNIKIDFDVIREDSNNGFPGSQ